MIICPIINKEISEDECCATKVEAKKSSKEKLLVQKKFKRIVGWNYICCNCKNHK